MHILFIICISCFGVLVKYLLFFSVLFASSYSPLMKENCAQSFFPSFSYLAINLPVSTFHWILKMCICIYVKHVHYFHVFEKLEIEFIFICMYNMLGLRFKGLEETLWSRWQILLSSDFNINTFIIWRSLNSAFTLASVGLCSFLKRNDRRRKALNQ